ncbi:DUF4229 domain-containing protein [Pontimonas sp.]|nr:DUF4229 domain-containing protein [Pontimonas sp.]
MTRWIRYSVLRLGIFVVVLVALSFTGITWWLSALLATAIAFALSYIFLSHQRDELSRDIAARLNRKKTDVDAESEDAAELPREGNTKK